MAEPFQTSDNLTVQIDWLQHELRNARNNEVNILSPVSFAEAEELAEDAKKRLDRGDKQSKILQKVAGAQILCPMPPPSPLSGPLSSPWGL